MKHDSLTKSIHGKFPSEFSEQPRNKLYTECQGRPGNLMFRAVVSKFYKASICFGKQG